MMTVNGYEKVEVSRACGHTDTVSITQYKSPKNRERKLAKLSAGLCHRCFLKKTLEEHDLKPLAMKYTEYKRRFKRCLIDWDSYDADEKSITVYVRSCWKTDEELASALVSEFGVSEEQALFLATRGMHQLYDVEVWLRLDPQWKYWQSVFERIWNNDPSYMYDRLI